ncbi:MAG: DUF1801 domain-containing protein [Planctomycetota bacterium]
MSVKGQIKAYIDGQPEPKRSDLKALHTFFLELLPGCRLWFLDGKNGDGKVVSNPNVGYGLQVMKYADGSTKEFYQVGMSANTAGTSVYILGIEDKAHLASAYGGRLGKASVSGYCIKFRALSGIHMDVLGEAVRYGVEVSGRPGQESAASGFEGHAET